MAETFESMAMPLLGAAFTLAYWVTRSRADAHDVVQDAYLRAWQGYSGFRGQNFRSWFLAIVRNCAYKVMNERRRHSNVVPFEAAFAEFGGPDGDRADEAPSAEALLLRADEAGRVRAALALLAPAHREILILREIEDLSYRDIAEVTGTVIGTVMSRLSRARLELRAHLERLEREEERGHGAS